MADKIRVDPERLARTKKELEERLDRIWKDIDRLSKTLEGLNAMWEGEAHEAFCGRAAEDCQLLREVCGGLGRILCYEGEAVTAYRKCARQVEDVIGQIRI